MFRPSAGSLETVRKPDAAQARPRALSPARAVRSTSTALTCCGWEKIILFGSAARGSAGPGSDLDLLVVKSGDYHHIELAQRIYMAIHAPKFAIDVTVATPEEVERYRDDFCLVLYPALREGKVVYDAHAA